MPRHLCYTFCFLSLIISTNNLFAQQISPRLMLPIGSKLEVLSAQFSPDGKRIVTASADKTALVWDAGTGNLLLILDDHKDIVSAAEFSPDGKKIVTASYDNMVRVWDAITLPGLVQIAEKLFLRLLMARPNYGMPPPVGLLQTCQGMMPKSILRNLVPMEKKLLLHRLTARLRYGIQKPVKGNI